MISEMQRNLIITGAIRREKPTHLARESKTDIKTVKKVLNEAEGYIAVIKNPNSTQEERCNADTALFIPHKYDSSKRFGRFRKFTQNDEKLLETILREEEEKNHLLGNHKQHITVDCIYQRLVDAGCTMSRSGVAKHIRARLKRFREAFIRQEYPFGQRAEFDFGDVKLWIKGRLVKLAIAVFGLPASDYLWARLYYRKTTDAVIDSHVRFYDEIGGVPEEMFYDNLKNMVISHVRGEKVIYTRTAIAMASHYGFKLNATNPYRGNEKGSVERGVSKSRCCAFITKYKYDSLEEAQQALADGLRKHNATTAIEEEKKHLQPAPYPFQTYEYDKIHVDKYFCVRYQNNHYSVPDYLKDREVDVKIGANTIVIHSNGKHVATHERKFGRDEWSIDIFHFIKTLLRKPGALRNSTALKCHRDLKAVFDLYYEDKPKRFIEILNEHKSLTLPEIIAKLEEEATKKEAYQSSPYDIIAANVRNQAINQLKQISELQKRGVAL